MPIDGRSIGSQIEKRGSRLRKEIFVQRGPGSSTPRLLDLPQAILTAITYMVQAWC
jgi:hypothetical protein